MPLMTWIRLSWIPITHLEESRAHPQVSWQFRELTFSWTLYLAPPSESDYVVSCFCGGTPRFITIDAGLELTHFLTCCAWAPQDLDTCSGPCEAAYCRDDRSEGWCCMTIAKHTECHGRQPWAMFLNRCFPASINPHASLLSSPTLSQIPAGLLLWLFQLLLFPYL